MSVIGLAAGWAISAGVSWGILSKGDNFALALLVLGAIATTMSALGAVLRTVREWKALEADTMGSVGKNMSCWYEAIGKIRTAYSRKQIVFAQGYVADVAAQARGRLSFFVGALEKVGVIPLLASTAVALANFSKDGAVPLLWCTAAAVAGLFYLLAMRLVDIAFMLERFALILKHATAEQDKH
nr:hypothetical protein [Cupriavidus taiwanensis]